MILKSNIILIHIKFIRLYAKKLNIKQTFYIIFMTLTGEIVYKYIGYFCK